MVLYRYRNDKMLQNEPQALSNLLEGNVYTNLSNLGQNGGVYIPPNEIPLQEETNLVNLRRTIYLTIMSASVDYKEAGDKLLQIMLEPGQEVSNSVHAWC